MAPALISRNTKALTTSIKIGTFQITGTFSPPRGFQFTVTDGGQTLFSMSGLLATATQTGSYTLSFNGQTDSGIIPTLGTPFPTTTATPVPTVTPGTGGFASTLTFTPSSGSNFVGAPLTSGPFTLISNIIGGGANSAAAGKYGVFLAATGLTATVGSVKTLTPIGLIGGNYIYNTTTAGALKVFVAESGTITLTALSQNSATFTFKNVVYAANAGNIAMGKVTVNGTLTGPLKRL